MEEKIREYFSREGAEYFDDIVLMRKLGTVANIKAIGCMYADLAEHATENLLTSHDLILRVMEITDYFKQTRGKLSCSISTAMDIMIKGLANYNEKSLKETIDFLTRAYPQYELISNSWLEKIKQFSFHIIKNVNSVLLYDYSSTVASILEIAAANGKILEVYIPCSGVLYGGRQFVIDAVKYGHKPFFFQDVAMCDFIKRADLALIGAESIYPDGGASNSIGSDIVAALCKIYGTPLYVVSSMLKYDSSYITGSVKKRGFWDLRERMPVDLPQNVRNVTDFKSMNLIQINADSITAFITEIGVIPPNAMFHVGRNYLNHWKE
ncbi:MAG: hypothetical protein RR415_10400 [Ruthenibacterium sp.]